MLTNDCRGKVLYFMNVWRGEKKERRYWREIEGTRVSGENRVHSEAAELSTHAHTQS